MLALRGGTLPSLRERVASVALSLCEQEYGAKHRGMTSLCLIRQIWWEMQA